MLSRALSRIFCAIFLSFHMSLPHVGLFSRISLASVGSLLLPSPHRYCSITLAVLLSRNLAVGLSPGYLLRLKDRYCCRLPIAIALSYRLILCCL